MADNSNVYFMSAVGFKPPHKGHIQMIKEAVEKAAARSANYKLFIGQAQRDGITLSQSLQMLKIFLNGEDVSIGDGIGEVSINPVAASNPTGKTYSDNPKNRKLGRVGKKVYTNSPLQPMINLIHEMPEGGSVVVPTSSEDADRAEKLKKILSYSRPDIEVEGLIVEPTVALEGEGKLSATDMRKAINGGDFEKFKKFIPESSLGKAEGIWTDILGRELPVNNLDSEVLNEMIVEGLKNKIKNLLSEGWAENDPEYQWDQADAQEGELDWRDPLNYIDEDDENPDSDHWREILQNAVAGDIRSIKIRDAVYSLRHERRLDQREGDLEEISAAGGPAAAVEGGVGAEEGVLVREVYNYLMNSDIIRTKTNAN
jgi:hypothetical protein